MNKLLILPIVMIIASFMLASCGNETVPSVIEETETKLLPSNDFGARLQLERQRDALYQFIADHLTGVSGVYTNYKDTSQSAEMATGHEVLSESSGLKMRYYALTNQQQAFDEEWALAKRNFDLDSGFSYRYSPLHAKRYPLNAAVDDLRIIRALHEAEAVFRDSRYSAEAVRYGNRFFKHNIKDGYVYDFYDETYNITNSFITLCYIDLKTLRLLPGSSNSTDVLMTNMLGIIKKGYLTDQFPFYETRYNYDSKSYGSETIRTVESLLTILSLTEVRQHNEESIRYIKEHVKAGTLYGSYTKAGIKDTDIQSTAIYAITAMIGSELGDQSLYEDSIERMNELQVWEEGSPLYGGFADTAANQAYSFDNLMALIAYSY